MLSFVRIYWIPIGLFVLGLTLGMLAKPAPEPVTEYVPSPYAVPSPYEVRVVEPSPYEVEVAPKACLDAIDDLTIEVNTMSTFTLDVLDAYVSYPDEDLGQFGARVEDAILTFDVNDLPDYPQAAVDECEAAR